MRFHPLLQVSLLTCLTGCSVIAEPGDRLRCEATPSGTNPCPTGWACIAEGDGGVLGFCERTECMSPGTAEACNGRDDDCDGRIDEETSLITELCNASDDDCDGRIDEGFDADGDGYNACGTQGCTLDPDGAPCVPDTASIDCDDDDRDINPGARELCDGTDNDCDGMAFPPGPPDPESCIAPRDALCPVGEVCETDVGCVPLDCATGRACSSCGERQICVDGECETLVCDPTTCGPLEFCESGSPTCVRKKDNGADCDRNDECLSDLCIPAVQLGLPSARSGLCFEACCNDAECPSGQFCWSPSTGARSCMIPRPEHAAITGRDTDTLGLARGGAACSSDSECRSGLCTEGTCFEACGVSSDCDGTSCGITADGVGCRVGGDIGAECSTDSECSAEVCRSATCLSQTCTERSLCPLVPGADRYCAYVAYPGGRATSVCLYSNPPSPILLFAENRPYGASCQTGFCESDDACCTDRIPVLGTCTAARAGCQTHNCVNNRCTDVCCSDASCPGDDVCRPQRVTFEGDTYYPMVCVPPA